MESTTSIIDRNADVLLPGLGEYLFDLVLNEERQSVLPRGRRRADRRASSGRPPDDNPCPDPVELVLYVSARSAQSAQAIGHIKRVLERFDPSHVKLTICDLSQQREDGVDKCITYTPTLMRRGSGPRTFILGHISNPQLVLDLLADCDREGI
jgi:hypothetical protein